MVDGAEGTGRTEEAERLRAELAAVRRQLEMAAPSLGRGAIPPARLAAIDTVRRDLLTAAGDRADDAPVTTDAQTFRIVASVLGELAALARACGGEDCLARARDGIRTFVPADRLERETARAERAEAEADALRSELAIARMGSLGF